MKEMSVIQFWPTFGWDYTWIEHKKIPQSNQSTLMLFLWIKARWTSVSSVGYHFSWTSFVLSPSRCWLSTARFSMLSGTSYHIQESCRFCRWKCIPSTGSVPRPRFSSLTEEVINRSYTCKPSAVSSGQKHAQLSGSYWSDKRILRLKLP